MLYDILGREGSDSSVSSSLISLRLLTNRNISAVPIVDEEGRVIDLYHRFDVTFIALAGDAEQTMSNLNMCLSDLLPQRRGTVGYVMWVGRMDR